MSDQPFHCNTDICFFGAFGYYISKLREEVLLKILIILNAFVARQQARDIYGATGPGQGKSGANVSFRLKVSRYLLQSNNLTNVPF